MASSYQLDLDELRPPGQARAAFEASIRDEYMVEPSELSLVTSSIAADARFDLLDEPDAAPIAAWWSREPESLATYSAFAPGDLPALARVREPFGRVHLAGEHTEVVNGFLESALRSGRSVAARWR